MCSFSQLFWSFLLNLSALKLKVTFPAPCTWRVSTGTFVLTSVASIQFPLPSGSILFPSGNQGREGRQSHASFIAELSPSKEDDRGKFGASQGHAMEYVGLWQYCQLIGTGKHQYNTSGKWHHFFMCLLSVSPLQLMHLVYRNYKLCGDFYVNIHGWTQRFCTGLAWHMMLFEMRYSKIINRNESMSKTVVIHNNGVINSKSDSNINDSSSGKRWGIKRNLSQDSSPLCWHA